MSPLTNFGYVCGAICVDMTTKNEFVLPLGNRPFWDKKRGEEEDINLKSVSESCVLSLSLKQSRERWLLKTFSRFSSRSRNNKDPAPPPHTIQTRGTCSLVIGPHVFTDTVFYEVHYLHPQGYQPSSFSSQPLAANPYMQSTSYSQAALSGNALGNSTTTQKPDNGGSSSSLDSLPASIPLTPHLIQQVNSAASSNPILANLLQLAAAGRATEDQLKTLGLLIQSFASLSSLSSTQNQVQPGQPAIPSYSPYPGLSTRPPVKEFDLVFEFRETPNDRWYIPRVPVYVERKPSADTPNELDVTLLTCIPFTVEKDLSTEQEGEQFLQYPIVFTLKNAPYTIWETVWRWVGGESKNTANKAHIEKKEAPPRLYLGHQLAPGPQLTQLQGASAPPYSMRTLKQGPSNSRSARPKRKKEPDTASVSKPKNDNAAGDTIVVKRPRANQSKTIPLVPIHCTSCKNTDVPLILGGKYCRPCAEIEKQKSNTTPTTPTAPA